MNYFKFLCIALCAFVLSSCMDDGDGSALVCKVKKDNIAFRLSLLNEQGEPANVFNEGENFIFHFEMENLRKNDKREYYGQLLGEMYVSGFTQVFNQNGEWIGSPFSEGGGCDKNLSSFSFNGNEQVKVSIPWNGSGEEEWWRYKSCYFKWDSPSMLPKGDYYTGFTYTFKYRIPSGSVDIPSSEVETGPVTMKVYFTVK